MIDFSRIRCRRTFVFAATSIVLGWHGQAAADPHVVKTTVVGPLVGIQAPVHPDNLRPERIRFYGTDLGFTYEHAGKLQILFGDTTASPEGGPIEPSNGRRFDDSFGSIDLDAWNDPRSFSREHMPLVRLGQNPGSAEAAAIDPGHAMEEFKTPVGGFSNGADEYGVFYTYKPEGCRSDADCSNGASCDLELGYIGPPYTDDAGLTWACLPQPGSPCNPATMRDNAGRPIDPSGFCTDRNSTIWADTPMGRMSSLSVKLLIGIRDKQTPKRYQTGHVWQTSKFMNPTFRTVRAYEAPAEAPAGFTPDFRPATGISAHAKVFIWGRPHFVGVNATGRTLGAYFAYVNLPSGDTIEWQPQYFTGLDEAGEPQFSPNERDAAPLDEDAGTAGIQAAEPYDVVNQVSVAWVPQLSRWVMFYGGGLISRPLPPLLAKCGVLELFTGPECTRVVIGNGAFHMRSSVDPWGSWTTPRDLIEAGDPGFARGQYGSGGMLRHPDCTAPDCAPTTAREEERKDEYGFFYSANIIEQWTRPAGNGVEIIWNASTWDPYRVILLRTRLDP